MKNNITTQIDQESKANFKNYTALFDQVFGKNGRIGIIYYLSVLFSDIIFKNSGKRFPILFAHGKAGTGKSTMIQSLMNLIGENDKKIYASNSNYSIFTFLNKLQAKHNSFVWLDEYTNNLPYRTINFIKNVYDRIGYASVHNSGSMIENSILSALIVSGQDIPTKDITLLSRVILMRFTRSEIRNTDMELYKQLIYIKPGLLYQITVGIQHLRPLFEAKYKETYLATLSEFSNNINNNEIEERMIMNYAVLITTMVLVHKELDLPFTLDEFKQQCKEMILDQHSVMVNYYKVV